jgi:hypothetical protein
VIDTWLTEEYFRFLKQETFFAETDRREFEGVLRVLHDIPFIWLIHSDDNRVGDAISYRQSEFLDSVDTRGMDKVALGQWATASPSVLEVMLGIAHRWCFYFGEGSVAHYFGHLFRNMGFDQFPGRALHQAQQAEVRRRTDVWLTRQFYPNGIGSPFPLNQGFGNVNDQRSVDIWAQMNAYSAEHFQ